MAQLKKAAAVLAALALLCCGTLPAGAEGTETPDAQTVYGIYNSGGDGPEGTLATGLITGYSIQLSKSGDSLFITGNTYGAPDVEKVGFTYVKLQRLESGVWTDYRTYTDQYTTEFISYALGKAVTADHGYTYRVICEHYAEKTLFLWLKSTQSIYNETTTLYF